MFTMKYKLDINRLQPGDIILAGYNDKLSKCIQDRTNSQYSHAMLYWYGSIIHASDIVITENPSRQLYEEGEHVCVLRLKEEYQQPLRIKQLIDYARGFVGTLYDNSSLIAMAKGREFIPNKNRQMCAKFIAQCFEYVCADLVDDYEKCSPQDLINPMIVNKIEDILIEATAQDEKFANSPDVTKLQFDAVLNIIKTLYNEFPKEDIMSLKQLDLFLKAHPEQDLHVVDIMDSTQYFNLWQIEHECCPYLYDIDKFDSFWLDNKVFIALQMKKGCKRIIEERSINKSYYNNLICEVGPLAYYKKMSELQDNIISTANERIKVANLYLEKNQIVKIPFPWVINE